MGGNGVALSVQERCRVVRETADLMLKKYGPYPNKKQFSGFEEALEHMFPNTVHVI